MIKKRSIRVVSNAYFLEANMEIREIVEVEEIGYKDKEYFLKTLNEFIDTKEFRIINIDYNPVVLDNEIYFSALITYSYNKPV